MSATHNDFSTRLSASGSGEIFFSSFSSCDLLEGRVRAERNTMATPDRGRYFHFITPVQGTSKGGQKKRNNLIANKSINNYSFQFRNEEDRN